MNNFTAGPWHTGSGNCHTVYSSQSNGHQRIIARCPTQNGPVEYDSHETFLNAKLIASAPELLAALVALYEETADYIRINNLGNTLHNKSMQLAHAAIVKAGQP